MNGNKYETAVAEVRSVLGEWLDLVSLGQRIDSPFGRDVLANKIVERLIAKGVIQSTDPDELTTPVSVRRGALPPGRTVIGGDEQTRAERFQEAKDWALTEHGETLRRLGEGPSEEHLPAPGSVQRNEDGG
jgi:hypothetical protein